LDEMPDDRAHSSFAEATLFIGVCEICALSTNNNGLVVSSFGCGMPILWHTVSREKR